MNQFASTAALPSQGILKKAYPNSSPQQEMTQALQNRARMLEQRVKAQTPNPIVGQEPTMAFPVVDKPPGLTGSPGRNTPISKSSPMRNRAT